jgi:oligopeptide/dipeptide ABC transporter ATP-binding protein
MPAAEAPGQALLRAVSVSAGYGTGRRAPNVLHDVSLAVTRRRTIGVVGESGSGKSTLARVLVGQLRPAHGQVQLGGTDLGALRGQALQAARRRIQLVPQDPYASLDPRMTVRRALAEAIDPHGRRPRQQDTRIAELLRTVALDPDAADHYPHEFSGGQRQRIAITRALAVQPEVIIADEVTSSLDASVQAEILNLLQSIQAETAVGMVFITHDLSVANYLCDEICVLYLGRIVERGSNQVLFQPDHPYTQLLVDSIPSPGHPDPAAAPAEAAEPPDPVRPPDGCPFHPRCVIGPARFPDHQACLRERPALTARWPEGAGGGTRATACHYPLISPSAGETAGASSNSRPT